MVVTKIRWFGLLGALLLVGSAGCDYTWRAKTVQPPLRLDLGTEARTSLRGYILMGDQDLPRITGLDGIRRKFKLANSAYFVVVNRDRLRFRVSLVHKWEKIADPARWRVYLEDSHGNRYYARGVESRRLKPVTKHFQVGEFMGSGTHSYPLLSVHVYNGTGDYVFHETDIFSDAINSLTLVMKRPGYEYRYSWQFSENDERVFSHSSEAKPPVISSR